MVVVDATSGSIKLAVGLKPLVHAVNLFSYSRAIYTLIFLLLKKPRTMFYYDKLSYNSEVFWSYN